MFQILDIFNSSYGGDQDLYFIKELCDEQQIEEKLRKH